MDFWIHFALQFRCQAIIQLVVLSGISLTVDQLTYKLLLRFHFSRAERVPGGMCQPAYVIAWLADWLTVSPALSYS
jgi:hypothetical protein